MLWTAFFLAREERWHFLPRFLGGIEWMFVCRSSEGHGEHWWTGALPNKFPYLHDCHSHWVLVWSLQKERKKEKISMVASNINNEPNLRFVVYLHAQQQNPC